MAILTRSGFALPGTSNQFHTGTWRVQRPVHHLQNAPCHSACPAGENAQAWLADLEVGEYRRAWETIVSVNPIPAITGRVCHHPCEGACNRGQYDQAIAIHGVERYLGDNAIEQGWDYPVAAAPRNANQIAVVGAGPAGLSAAYHLVRQGHRVTLFAYRTAGLPPATRCDRSGDRPHPCPRNRLSLSPQVGARDDDRRARK